MRYNIKIKQQKIFCLTYQIYLIAYLITYLNKIFNSMFK